MLTSHLVLDKYIERLSFTSLVITPQLVLDKCIEASNHFETDERYTVRLVDRKMTSNHKEKPNKQNKKCISSY